MGTPFEGEYRYR
ncbi:hypothetical protein A2U01_0093126, partial [Trifolium medium]|nr:hypothetical protein [Trifolium medium]